ncbi:MAG: type II toxin-antitoxin system VapC family toxin [Roseimicrobium sp.]
MAWLLDTNVISELRRGIKCHPNVRAWAEACDDADFFVSVLTLGEIRDGIERQRKRDPAQASALENWLNTTVKRFEGRIHPVCQAVADRWGKLLPGESLPDVDALIAATALEHGLTIATRNVRDFIRCGVPVVNPFE